MAGNALISWVNHVDRAGATITASSQVSTLPATRLATPPLRQRWRTTSNTADVTIDWGSALTVDVLALAQPDDAGGIGTDGEAAGWMASTDTVRHRLDATTAGAGALLDTGAVAGGWVPGYGVHVDVLSSSLSARYWRADIVATSLASAAAFDLGRAWAGPAYRFGRNFSYGWSARWADAAGVIQNPRSGLETVDTRFRQRVLAFSFDALTDADMAVIVDLQRLAGTRKQVLFVPDPDGARMGYQAVIGRLTDISPVSQQFLRVHRASFAISHTL